MDGGLGEGGAGGLFKMCCVFGEASWDVKGRSALKRDSCTALPPDSKSAGKRFSPVSSVDFKGQATVAMCVSKTVTYRQRGGRSWTLREESGDECA